MDYYVNENVKSMERVFPQQGRYNYYRYDMNENPEGLPDEFVNTVLKEITPEFLSTYPDPDGFVKKYAEFVGVNSENVLTTNGSDMAIRYLLEVFGETGKEVVTVSPSFEMYWVNCCLLGLKHVPVAYESDWTIKVENIIAAISDNTRIVVLLNPNNPIGNVYTEAELQQVIKRAKEVGAIVIVDEAYHYFYPETFVDYAVKEENVVVLRTFSKLFSIAACRLGVIISNPQIINYVQNLRLTFDVNSVALLFGERILDNPDLTKHLIEAEKEGRQYILNTMHEKGYECIDCNGNFVFIKSINDAHEVSKRLKEEKNILVHPYNNEMLKDYIRVSVGSRKAMEFFVDAFLEVDDAE